MQIEKYIVEGTIQCLGNSTVSHQDTIYSSATFKTNEGKIQDYSQLAVSGKLTGYFAPDVYGRFLIININNKLNILVAMETGDHNKVVETLFFDSMLDSFRAEKKTDILFMVISIPFMLFIIGFFTFILYLRGYFTDKKKIKHMEDFDLQNVLKEHQFQ